MANAMAKSKESFSHFDADAIAAAQEEPKLIVDRFLYRGRILSIEEWLPFWERLQALDAKRIAADGQASVAALHERMAFYRGYLRAVFPKRRYRFWAPDPVAHLCAQSFETVEKAIGFFFILQASATFGLRTIATPTLGPSSKPSTTPPLVGAASE